MVVTTGECKRDTNPILLLLKSGANKLMGIDYICFKITSCCQYHIQKVFMDILNFVSMHERKPRKHVFIQSGPIKALCGTIMLKHSCTRCYMRHKL